MSAVQFSDGVHERRPERQAGEIEDDPSPLIDSEHNIREQYSFTDSECKTFGRKLRRLFHWGPMIAIFFILYIFATGLYCILVWWPPLSSPWRFLHFMMYIGQLYLVMSNYLRACFYGPGFVPLRWTPARQIHTNFLQWCVQCQGYKPPRAHHCSMCQRCVLKMDHHCPWINTCCGHVNHGYFVRFLLAAPEGCIHAMIILGICLWQVVSTFLQFIMLPSSFDGRRQIFLMGIVEFAVTVFAFTLALSVTIAVGILCVVQLLSIMKNETAIEDFIKRKAKHRRQQDGESAFRNPYDLATRWANIKQVLTFSGATQGNGYDWTVRPGAHRFDMTIEQLKQKRDKWEHSELASVGKDFNGNWFPWRSLGCRVACSRPCTVETLIAVRTGELMRVTRWREHWVYGQVIHPDHSPVLTAAGRPRRGWVPNLCLRTEAQTNGAAAAAGEEDTRHNKED